VLTELDLSLQRSLEEGDDVVIEALMKCSAVKARFAGADCRHAGCQLRRARLQKIVMPGVSNDVRLGWLRQSEPNGFRIIGLRQHLIILGPPELYRLEHRRQTLGPEGEAESGRGGDDCLDSPIVGPNDVGIQRQRVRCHDLTVFEAGMRLAVIRKGPQVRLAAGGRQHCQAACREAERANAIGIEALVVAPRAQHVIRQQL
jgi:hypothetical protein